MTIFTKDSILASLFLSFFLLPFECFGQNFPVYPSDRSNKNFLKQLSNDTTQIAQWTKKGIEENKAANYDSATKYFKKAIALYEPYKLLSQDSLFWDWYINLNGKLGECYTHLSKYAKADQLLNSMLEVAKTKLSNQKATIALIHYNLAFNYDLTGNYDEALKHYQMALENYSTIKQDGNKAISYSIGNCYNGIGIMHDFSGRFELALEYYTKALDIYRITNGEKSSGVANAYGNIAIMHKILGRYEQALEFYHKSLSIRLEIFDPKHPNIAVAYQSLGVTYNDLGQTDLALSYLNKALEIDLERFGENHPKIASRYESFAKIYVKEGQYELAREFFQKSTLIKIALFGNDNPQLCASYSNLGQVHGELNQIETALDYFQKAKSLYLKHFGPSHYDLGKCYDQMGALYQQIGQAETALFYQKKALDIKLKTYSEVNQEVATTYSNMGSLYEQLNQPEKALSYFEKALSIRKEIFGEQSDNVAITCHKMSVFFQNEGRYEQALAFCQKALAANVFQFNSDDIRKNPVLTDSVLSKSYLVVTLRLKADILYDVYAKTSKNIDDLLLSDNTYELAEIWNNQTRQSFKRVADKNSLSEVAMDAHEGHLEVCLKLYQLTKKAIYQEKIFKILESNRALSLLESLQYSKARTFAGVPDSLVLQEIKLNSRIAFYEKQLFGERLKNEKADQSKITSWEEKVFQFKHERDLLNQFIEHNFPEYYRLKYNTQVVSIENVQQILEPDQALLEYFVGKQAIYTFLVRQDRVTMSKLDLDFPLTEQIQSLRNGLYGYWLLPAEGRTEEQFVQFSTQYVTAAAGLYEKLIAPLSDLPEKLIIIPDGILGYLPFETLLFHLPEEITAFKNHSYLGRSHQISYNYSATLWKEMRDKQHNKSKGLLAFAPTFGEEEPLFAGVEEYRRNNFGNLFFNIPEANTIAGIFNGEAITGNDATLESFLEQAQNYSILHLATHAKLNDLNSDYSFLAFTGATDSLDQGKMFIRDLYNLRLPAELVVLSACETGVGKLQKGEGIISLARGFTFAGAKSIVTSLWEVNDLSASEIMKDYYTGLKNGERKELALHQAKMAYIDKQVEDRQAHPFFWAAFVGIGDMRPLNMNNSKNWILGLLALGVCFFALAIYKRRFHF